MSNKRGKNLTKEQKLEIRELYATGDWKQNQLAEKYGVCIRTIARVVEGIKKPTYTVLERFSRKYVIDENGCWVWTGCVNEKGYGQISIGSRRQRANRISYQLYKGEIPEGQLVRHTCDNPACVNPEHLILGTALQNGQDKKDRHRQPWKYPATVYLEMKAFHEVGISPEWIELHYGISKRALKRKLTDMNKTADDPIDDEVFRYQKRAIDELNETQTA